MVYANCNNEDCPKDQWWLKKPPHKYSSGGPKCPECGTTRVSIDDDETAPAAAPAGAESGSSNEQAQPPQQQQQADQQGQGGLPQTQQDAVEAGQKVAGLVANLDSSTPEEAAQTEASLFTAAGSAVAAIGQELAAQKMEGAKRAKDADQSSLKKVDDYISCPECGGQITDLPAAGQQFQCPHCSTMLESQG